MRTLSVVLFTAVAIGLTSCRSPRPAMPPPLEMAPINRPTVIASAAARGMVRVDFYDREIAVWLKYASPDNVFGRVLYPPGFPALASRPTALKLAMANARLRSRGLRLVVFDAYRPPEVQWQLFQQFGSDRYVADPRKQWSKHTYGRAVDVALIDADDRLLKMPSAFDDFSEKAAATYQGDDPEVRANLAILQEVMTRSGFAVYPDEWWHFNDLSNPAAVSGPPIFGRELGMPVASKPRDRE